MKIVLLNPYYSFTGKTQVYFKASIPYNLLYIQGYLLKHDIVSSVVDIGPFNENQKTVIGDRTIYGSTFQEIKNMLDLYEPKIVGITTMFTVFHEDYTELARFIHRVNPEIRVVCGGNHASCFPQKMLDGGFDQVVVGEGEQAFLAIANGNKDPIVEMPMLKDLDDVPIPIMEVDFFNLYSGTYNPYIMRHPVMGIITSRGCPQNCIYCTVNGVWKRRWRGMSPKRVVDEMQVHIQRYGIKEFHFLDDNVSVDRVRWVGILDEIIKRKLNIKFATPMAYWTIDEYVLDKMKKAGCYRLSFGIESGDSETRKFIGKTNSLECAKRIIKYANKIGLWTITTNIIGFPYETAEQIQKTVDFAKESEADFGCFFNLIPHASSRIYPYYIKEGLIKEGDDLTSVMNEGGCDTKFFTKDQLKQKQADAYAQFIKHKIFFYLTHPWSILRKIHSWEDFRYVARLAILGFDMFIKTISKKVSSTSKDFIYGKKQYIQS